MRSSVPLCVCVSGDSRVLMRNLFFFSPACARHSVSPRLCALLASRASMRVGFFSCACAHCVACSRLCASLVLLVLVQIWSLSCAFARQTLLYSLGFSLFFLAVFRRLCATSNKQRISCIVWVSFVLVAVSNVWCSSRRAIKDARICALLYHALFFVTWLRTS